MSKPTTDITLENNENNVRIRIWKPEHSAWYRWELQQRFDETWDWEHAALSDGYTSLDDALKFANQAMQEATRNMRSYSPEFNPELAHEDFAYARKAFEILEYFGIKTWDILHVKSPVDFERIREQIITNKP